MTESPELMALCMVLMAEGGSLTVSWISTRITAKPYLQQWVCAGTGGTGEHEEGIREGQRRSRKGSEVDAKWAGAARSGRGGMETAGPVVRAAGGGCTAATGMLQGGSTLPAAH